jgi:hypothetical protein
MDVGSCVQEAMLMPDGLERRICGRGWCSLYCGGGGSMSSVEVMMWECTVVLW